VSVVALVDSLKATEPRVLTFDIETAPALAYVWGSWQVNINPEMIVEPSRVLCWAGKWFNEKQVFSAAEWEPGGHRGMLEKLWEALDAADIVCGYNSNGFDIKHVNRSFIEQGYLPPSPYQTVDLIKTVRGRFKFPSNRLGQIGKALDIGGKLDTGGWSLWENVLAGDDKARAKFLKYCRQDVRLTDQLLRVLSPWIKGLPHHGLWSNDMACCYACGSTNLHPYGFTYTKTQTFLRLACDCGAYNRLLSNGQTRPA
jgi:hypothetical protein